MAVARALRALSRTALRAVRGALLETGTSCGVEGEHLECRGGRLVQRRAATLQQAHERLHPPRLRHLRRRGRVEREVLERARGSLLRGLGCVVRA